ncbi:tripartite tricarboxylate transporter substrate-binding protein [Polynucleobacter alcilacus]|jgi:tripartite-type tricarboxylate transporter receptor subunit TctC|uniref:tripartite tricarboxylate transporter substrate-binding protein n=1 Tax=Polynucleobacter alcilacus TaxID=1819739 RepID=UPI001C0ACA0F|nr:tripartite tricarboxylate transporter substrate-binding protein [Polynucleobacter alcilacus]MBU3567364.1 tripartite tricarboxylate transporter substrate binding protein BugD [Polynucleobacter alcilacus]
MKFIQKIFLAFACYSVSLVFAAYPDKQIVMVVPYAPAGSTDVLGRILAQVMSKDLGQTVIVENTGGAGGTIGSARVAKANPDGYTILFHNMAQAAAPALYAKLIYDPGTDFIPIGMVTDVPMVLVARKDFPAETLQGFIDYVRANPGKINFANAGIGSTTNLCESLMKSTLSASWTSVSYKGTGPALNDLLAGQVDVICDQPASTLQHIRAGNLKALAVASKDRISSMPTTPTFSQSGIPGFQLTVWHALYAPKDTPKATVDRLTKSLNNALKDPLLIRRYSEMDASVAGPETANPTYTSKFLLSDIERWKVAMKNAGIKPQ